MLMGKLRNTVVQIFKNKIRKDVRILSINLVGISVFCVALFAFKFFFSFIISTLSTNEKLKGVIELQFSLIAIMLGWTLYIMIALITGSLMEADIGSCSLYCGIFRFWIIVEKKSFKTLAVSLSFFKFWLLQQVLLLDSNGLTSFQFFIIAYQAFIQAVLLMSFFKQRLYFQMFYFMTNNYKTIV